MRTHIIDGKSMDGAARFHDVFSKEFDFPDYYVERIESSHP